MTSTPTIAFLGVGRMGLPMAMNLARALGHDRGLAGCARARRPNWSW